MGVQFDVIGRDVVSGRKGEGRGVGRKGQISEPVSE